MNGIQEKQLNLELARNVAQRLGGRGYMTRINDHNLSLADRAAYTSRTGARALVSIHADNDRDNNNASTTWIHNNANSSSKMLAKNIQARINSQYGSHAIHTISGELALLNPSLYDNNTAACLIETPLVGYGGINSTDGNIADAIADGILDYLGHDNYSAHYSESKGTVLPDYVPKGPIDAFKTWLDWSRRYISWTAGVEDTTIFPHSSICYIYGVGTAFYISKNRLLTAAHCVGGQTSLRIMPGFNAGSKPFGEFTVSATGSDSKNNWITYPGWNNGPFDNDIAVIRVNTPPNYDYFRLEVLEQSQPDPIIVCGYSALEDISKLKQRMDADRIRWLSKNAKVQGYNLQTLGGASGSPVFRIASESLTSSVENFKVHAVHVAAPSISESNLNRGCRITRDKLSWIQQLINGWP